MNEPAKNFLGDILTILLVVTVTGMFVLGALIFM